MRNRKRFIHARDVSQGPYSTSPVVFEVTGNPRKPNPAKSLKIEIELYLIILYIDIQL